MSYAPQFILYPIDTFECFFGKSKKVKIRGFKVWNSIGAGWGACPNIILSKFPYRSFKYTFKRLKLGRPENGLSSFIFFSYFSTDFLETLA